MRFVPSDLPNFSCDNAAETVVDAIVVHSRSATQRELLRNHIVHYVSISWNKR